MISRIFSRTITSNFTIFSRYNNKFNFSLKNIPPNEIDPGNTLGLIQTSGQELMSFSQKLNCFRFGNMYDSIDIYSRQFMFTLANDYALGAGAAIIIISLGLKMIFLYPTLVAQVNGLKMQGLKKDMQTFKQKMKIGRMTGNMALAKQAQLNFNLAKKKKGVDNFWALLNMIQIPFLLTWFFSLRYITSLPQIYPQLQTQGFLWFPDLTSYDPYFLLPLIAATTMSYSIARSPNMSSLAITNPALAPLIKYLKYMPFFSLFITGMFPAGINLYWCTLSISQAFITILINNKYVIKSFGLQKQIKQAKILQAIIQQDKTNDSNSNTNNKDDTLQFIRPKGVQVQKITLVKNKPRKQKKGKIFENQ